jgi:hypothetical protein
MRREIEQGDFCTREGAIDSPGSSERTGASSATMPWATICASARPVKVLVIEAISKIESGWALP